MALITFLWTYYSYLPAILHMTPLILMPLVIKLFPALKKMQKYPTHFYLFQISLQGYNHPFNTREMLWLLPSLTPFFPFFGRDQLFAKIKF